MAEGWVGGQGDLELEDADEALVDGVTAWEKRSGVGLRRKDGGTGGAESGTLGVESAMA